MLSESWTPKRVYYDDEKSWLEARRKALTASDSRGILLQGYADESPHTIYEEKISEDPVVVDDSNDSFWLGHQMEPVCVAAFERVRKQKLKTDRRPTIRYSKKWDWMGATLDAWYYSRDGQLIPVEFKDVGIYNRKDWEDGVPLKVEIQVQHQIAVCNSDFGWVLAIAGREIICQRVVRDEDFGEALIRKLLEFKSHVDSRRPPPADWTGACERALSRLHPQDNGKCVTLPVEAGKVASELQKLQGYIKEATQEEKHRKNILRAMIGDHTYGILPGGNSGYSWKTQDGRKAVVCTCGKTIKEAGDPQRVLRKANKIPKEAETVPYQRLEDKTDGEASDSEQTERGTDAGAHSDGPQSG